MNLIRQFMLVGAGCAVAILGQEPKPGADASHIGFDVASVRKNPTRSGNSGSSKMEGRGVLPGEFTVEHARFTATGVSLYGLIVKAFGLTTCRPFAAPCVLLSGGPAWLAKDTFNIRAKAPDGLIDYSLIQFLNGGAPQLQAMLRILLEDRFRLKSHFEKRQLPVYALVRSNKEPKFRKADPTEESRIAFKPIVQSNGDNAIELFSKNGSMEELANLLSKFMDRPVLNQTGILGSFDFTIDYDANSDAPGPFTGATGPGMFRAFQDQLGLRLEATKGLVDVLIVDRVEPPAADN